MKNFRKGSGSWEGIARSAKLIIESIAPMRRDMGENDALRCRVFGVVLISILLFICLLHVGLRFLIPISGQGAAAVEYLLSGLGLGAFLVLLLFRVSGRLEVAAQLLGVIFWVALVKAATITGGIATPALSLFIVLPVMLGITVGSRVGMVWAVLVCVTWLGFLMLDSSGYHFEQIVTFANYHKVLIICLSLTCILVVIMLVQYEFINHMLREGLSRERENLEYLARHDQLTGLPNRHSFTQHWEMALERARRSNTRVAILFLDLDKFKLVNDQWGHRAGDQVLQEIARRLRGLLRTTDFIARWGGDEFAMIIENLGNQAALAQVAAKLVEQINQPLVIREQVFELDVSVGAAVYPDQGLVGEVLERMADQAMYVAKQSASRYVLSGSIGPELQAASPATS